MPSISIAQVSLVNGGYSIETTANITITDSIGGDYPITLKIGSDLIALVYQKVLPLDGIGGFKLGALVNRKIEYRPLGYVSKVLWHFVKGNETESASDVVIKKIIRGANNTLKKDPSGAKHHKRAFVSTTVASSEADEIPPFIEFLEPRALCFADIPIQYLPIHLREYHGIGFGFQLDSLKAKNDGLYPVWYIPIKTEDELRKHFVKDTKNEIGSYVKLPSQEEPFDKIYKEREWRLLSDFTFEISDLVALVFPTNSERKTCLEYEEIREMALRGVSMLSCEDLYEIDMRESE